MKRRCPCCQSAPVAAGRCCAPCTTLSNPDCPTCLYAQQQVTDLERLRRVARHVETLHDEAVRRDLQTHGAFDQAEADRVFERLTGLLAAVRPMKPTRRVDWTPKEVPNAVLAAPAVAPTGSPVPADPVLAGGEPAGSVDRPARSQCWIPRLAGAIAVSVSLAVPAPWYVRLAALAAFLGWLRLRPGWRGC